MHTIFKYFGAFVATVWAFGAIDLATSGIKGVNTLILSGVVLCVFIITIWSIGFVKKLLLSLGVSIAAIFMSGLHSEMWMGVLQYTFVIFIFGEAYELYYEKMFGSNLLTRIVFSMSVAVIVTTTFAFIAYQSGLMTFFD